MRLEPDDDIHFLALYQAVIGWHAGHRDPSSPIHDGDSFRAADLGSRSDARDRFVDDPNAIDAYLAADPDDLCASDRELVHPWRNFVRGDLVVARELVDHTIFLAWTDPPRAYAVVELFVPISEVLRKRPPLLVAAVLFPWRGGIVCDGVFNDRKVRLDRVLRREVTVAYREAKARGIITSLATGQGAIPPKRRGPRPRKPERPRPQWVGGIGSLPVTLIDGEDSYPPDVILWLDERGAILDKSAGNRLEALGLAAVGLFNAITKPRVGQPRVPASVRVASAPLARVLRNRFAEIEVVRAPTPEIDALVAKMRRRLQGVARARADVPRARHGRGGDRFVFLRGGRAVPGRTAQARAEQRGSVCGHHRGARAARRGGIDPRSEERVPRRHGLRRRRRLREIYRGRSCDVARCRC